MFRLRTDKAFTGFQINLLNREMFVQQVIRNDVFRAICLLENISLKINFLIFRISRLRIFWHLLSCRADSPIVSSRYVTCKHID